MISLIYVFISSLIIFYSKIQFTHDILVYCVELIIFVYGNVNIG